MRIHADFSQQITITPQDYQWLKSPSGEVNRMMLDRIGQEKARATSIVEFTPHSKFPKHIHSLGEEVLVISGIFTEDDDQHYPAGWYLRNPHQSAHQVFSEVGCQIFVKLMQMTESELTPTRINTYDPKNWISIQDRHLCPLFESEFEKTFLEKLDAHQSFSESLAKGTEILVISGEISMDSNIYPVGTWLRLPQKSNFQLKATVAGSTIYVKSGHLQHAIDVWINP